MKVFTYFIGADVGPIKIGKAKNVKHRLSELQTGHPYKLQILGVIYGDMRLESALHKKFGNIRLEGEWFERTPELTQFILNRTISYEINKDAEILNLQDRIKELNKVVSRLNSEERKSLRTKKANKAVILSMDFLVRQMEGAVVSLRDLQTNINTNTDNLGFLERNDIHKNIRRAVVSLVECDWRTADLLLSGVDGVGKENFVWTNLQYRISAYKQMRDYMPDLLKELNPHLEGKSYE
jgi:hypothetical protein